MDVLRFGFLQGILGPDGALALAKVAERQPGLAPVVIPRAVLSWLQLLDRDGDYEGDLPGVPNSYLAFSKAEVGYTGSISLGGSSYGFSGATPAHLAASIAVTLGVDASSLAAGAPQLRDVDLQRLGKSLDLLVKARAAAEQRELRKGERHEFRTKAPERSPAQACSSCGKGRAHPNHPPPSETEEERRARRYFGPTTKAEGPPGPSAAPQKQGGPQRKGDVLQFPSDRATSGADQGQKAPVRSLAGKRYDNWEAQAPQRALARAAAKAKANAVLGQALGIMSQDPGMQAAARQRVAQDKEQQLRMGGRHFKIGDPVRCSHAGGECQPDCAYPWDGRISGYETNLSRVNGEHHYTVAWRTSAPGGTSEGLHPQSGLQLATTSKAEGPPGPSAAPQKQGGPQAPEPPQKQPSMARRPPGRTPSIRLAMSELQRPCSACGQPQFAGERLVGCACFAALAPFAKTERTSEGLLQVSFGREWDADAVEVFLEGLAAPRATRQSR